MNRLFRRVIVTVLALGVEASLVMMLRFGPPMFKFMLVASIVAVVWLYINYLKTDRKVKTKKPKKNE